MSSDGRTQWWRIVFLSIALSLPGTLFAVSVSVFSPASGSTGTMVTIIGGPFVPGWTIAVTFNGTYASFTIDSPTQITATAPVGLTPGPITVIDGLTGNFTTTTSFTVAAPVITSFSPRSLALATPVTIAGIHLSDTTAVSFNGAAATFVNVSDSSITTKLPVGTPVGAGSISVTTRYGGTGTSPLPFAAVRGLIANPFFDFDVAPWSISSAYTANATLTRSSIDVEGSSASGSGEMYNAWARADVVASQCVAIPVTGGTRYTVAGRMFAPTGQPETGIAGIGVNWYSSPNCSTGLIGQNFTDGFIGAVVGSWTYPFINTAAPLGAQSASFLLSNWPDGATFRVLFDNLYFDAERPPSIQNFSPESGRIGTVVTINGNDLYGTTAVSFNGKAASFQIKSGQRIVATVPPATTTGPIMITAVAGSGSSFVPYTVPTPAISSLNPSSGLRGSVVNVEGTGLDSTYAVSFAGSNGTRIAAPFTLIGRLFGAPYIQTICPATAFTGALTLTNIDGAGDSRTFTVTLPSTITTLTSSINPSLQKQPVTLRATVTAASGTPTGTVNFVDGMWDADFLVFRDHGTVTLNGAGQASITTQDLRVGAIQLFARYSGDANFAASMSGPLEQTVNTLYTRGDFNGDNRADILLRDSGGNLGMWFMAGATITAGASVGSPGAYTVAGVADFNHDGKADILLRDSLGNLGLWLMNGSTIAAGGFVGAPGAYTVAGVADFNGDGKADVLLRDSLGNLGMWFMNGSTITGGGYVGSPAGYSVAAVADFDADGKADILLRDSLGNLGLWLMNGSTIIGGGYVGAAGGYQVVAVADFDFDGRADILFSDATGSLGMWLMSAQTIIGGGVVGAPGQYTVAAVKDYDGDGRYDILLRNPSTGDVRVWLMSGPSINTDAAVSPLPLAYSVQ